MKKHFLIAALLAWMIAATSAEDSASLYAGTAKVEITPPAGQAVNLLGKTLQPRDSLFARVLVLKTPETSVAIVSVDLIVYASKKVINEAKSKWGVDHVILCATHTHSAPAPRGLFINPPTSPDWTRFPTAPDEVIDWPALSEDPWYAATETRIIAAIGEAVKNLFPARIAAGKGSYEGAYMAHNRRLVRDGVGTAMWDNPDRRPTQPIDPTVGVLRVEDLSGKTRAFAVQYACHPVTLMNAGVVSRDFPGAMVDHLEEELGPDCLGMFLQGASGDLDPYDMNNLRGENRFNIVRQAGISLAKGALGIAADLKAGRADSQPILRVKESLLTLPNRQGGHATDVGLMTVLIGNDLAFMAMPGEPFIQHQLDLTARSPVANTFILGLAYHGRGTRFTVYIPTAQAVKEGGYGASECSFLAPDAGEQMVSEAVASLRKLKDRLGVAE